MSYYGTKKIDARPMNRQQYNEYRGWQLPFDEVGSDEGYLVEYLDGGTSNHPNHAGYISWSPKAQFEKAYQENGKLSFAHALVAMKAGEKVSRAGWNGKGMWVCLGAGSTGLHYENFWNKHTREFAQNQLDQKAEVLPYFIMKTADEKILMGWSASQSDMVAEDWGVV